jgi:hypothetical protein
VKRTIADWLLSRWLDHASDVDLGRAMGVVMAAFVDRWGVAQTREIFEQGLRSMLAKLAAAGVQVDP